MVEIEKSVLKPVRSISGVSVITVMTQPFPCPQASPCIYCPGGPSWGTPQSYTGKEPACMRALQSNFDPYEQVRSRVLQLERIGHQVDKVELIIFGGTTTAYPREYLEWFVKRCLDALNEKTSSSLQEAKLYAESAPRRVSNITFETRPDWCREEHVDMLLELGGTRVELGVQVPDDEVYKGVGRTHTVQDVIDATRIARDAGFQVSYHLMLGLPGSSPSKDLEYFRMIFEDRSFRPDGIKIYPTMVLPGTKLYELWRRGEYSPYSDEELLELLIKIKTMVPRWIRIHRILRDIPLTLVSCGPRRGDLRRVVQEEMKKRGLSCKCIRCREIGHVYLRTGRIPEGEIELNIEKYEAGDGIEYFLSLEKGEALVGLLRLRIPSPRAHRPEVKEAAIIRELHIFGPLVPVGRDPMENAWQHRGFGRKLVSEAEEIAKQEGMKKIVVLPGLGVREYYERLGFEKKEPYMCKTWS